MSHRVPPVERTCLHCGIQFFAKAKEARRGKCLCCSKSCAGKHARPDAETRFWSFVEKSADADGCWLWTGGTCQGYGTFADRPLGGGHPSHRAHRYAWEMAHGPIPAGRLVLHRCDNPPCVRPDHLFLGTHADNSKDCIEKGRLRRGSQRAMSKLTEADVIELRRLRAEGQTLAALSKRFGVGEPTVHKIALRKKWKHVA